MPVVELDVSDEGGTIRDLHTGREVGKTDNLARRFAEEITKGGPPCLIVGAGDLIDRLREYLPEWVEFSDEDVGGSHIYAFVMTLDEWKEHDGRDKGRARVSEPRVERREGGPARAGGDVDGVETHG